VKDLSSSDFPAMPGITLVAPTIEKVRASDEVQLLCRTWKGKTGYPVVVYLHGIEGHSLWFENTASVLNGKGMTVYAPDRRGSGINPRDRGNLTSYKTYLSDLEVFLRKVAFDHIGHSIILIGGCWGAKAATIICQKDYKPVGVDVLNLPIAGLALASPAIFTRVDYGMTTKFQIAYNSLLGGDHGSHKRWPIPIEPEMLTNNPTYQGFIKRDSHRLTELSSSFLVEHLRLSKLAEKAGSSLELPVLMLLAGADSIVDLEKMQQWYARIPSATKELRIFPDASHLLDFDSSWFKEYTHVLSEWILSLCPVVT
jgi:acylglycerol lipase